MTELTKAMRAEMRGLANATIEGRSCWDLSPRMALSLLDALDAAESRSPSAEVTRLRSALAASEAEVERLRHALLGPTHYESNGEAGDGQTVCNLCGIDAAEPHSMLVCIGNVSSDRDAALNALAELQCAAPASTSAELAAAVETLRHAKKWWSGDNEEEAQTCAEGRALDRIAAALGLGEQKGESDV